MKQSAYLRLKLPEYTDRADVQDLNDNFNAIDTELQRVASEAGDISNGTVFSNVASSRTNIESGDTLGTAIGKIRKFFADLKDGAFSTVANNTSTTAAGYVADARALKGVADRVKALETSFPDGCSKIATALKGGRDGNGTGGISTAKATDSPTTIASNIKAIALNNYNAAKVGTATAGDVIKGKTFTNSSTVGATGSLNDYRNNLQSVTTTAAGGTKAGTAPDSLTSWYEDLTLPAGVHSKVRVNKLATYKAGVTAADARTNTSSKSYTDGYSAGKTEYKAGNQYSGSISNGASTFIIPVDAVTIKIQAYNAELTIDGNSMYKTLNYGSTTINVTAYRGKTMKVQYWDQQDFQAYANWTFTT